MHRDCRVLTGWGLALLLCLLEGSATHAELPPTGKIIAAIKPENHRFQSTAHILNRMQLRVGQAYSQATAQEDVQRLMSTGWFRNVKIYTELTDNDQVIVSVLVDEVPNTVQEIVYRGAENQSFEELDKLTGLRRGMPLNPMANERARQAILRKYHEEGWLWAQVELREGRKLADRRVLFDILEGPKVRVSGIDFVGNQEIASGRLRTQITASKAFLGLLGGEYAPDQIEYDIRRLEEYYRALGFHDIDIDREVQWSDDHSRVRIVYHIDEGIRYQIRRVQLDGNKAYGEAELMAHVQARAGQYYDRSLVQADLSRIRDYYGLRGRQAAVRENIFLNDKVPGEVFVHYEVVERPPARVGRVIITGNTVTKDNVIRRQIPLLPGQILSFPDIAVGEQNLARLGLFQVDPAMGVRPTISVLDPESDSPFKDLLVQVEEQPTGSFLIGAGVNSDAGLSGSIIVNERNFDLFNVPTSFEDILAGRAFRGGGQEFRLEAVPGTVFQRYTASFREPSLFDSPYSLANSVYFFTRGFPEYNENRYGGRITLGRQFSPFWSANLTTRIEGIDVFDIPFNATPAISDDAGQDFLLGMRFGITRDRRNSFLRPTAGDLFEASFEQVVGDNDFPIGIFEYSRFVTTFERLDGSGKHVLSFRTQTSFTGSNAPVYERLYAGGFQSLRGFEFRGVGPFENGLNIGGTFAFLNSIEYQIPVTASDRLFLVGFVDSGAVESGVEINDYRVSAGVGLRIQVPMLGPAPIALDFGFPIVEGPNDREQIFSFWLGFFN